jgi:ZIP family zinc transporter
MDQPNNEWLVLAAATLLSAGAIAVGLLAAGRASRASAPLTLLAGLALVLVAAFHLAPEVFELGWPDRAMFAVGLALGAALEIVLHRRQKSDRQLPLQVSGALGLAALAVHSTIDGASYAAAFGHDVESGLLASVGLVLHEAPEGLVALTLALQAAPNPRGAVPLALLASTATTPLGWLATQRAGLTGQAAIDLAFSLSSGILLFAGLLMVSRNWRSLRALKAH